MVFNFKTKIIFCLSSLVLISSCGPVAQSDGNADVIGQKLESITPLRATDGEQKKKVSLYDPVVKKIHQFDLNQMTVLRTLPVLFPSEKHFVLDSGSSNYIVDLSEKHISIFDRFSIPQHQPIQMQGVPRSAAFRPDLGWLIVYDDLQSVGVLKLSDEGQVVDKYIFGSVVDGTNSIVSGDLLDDGRLVLALSDNSLSFVDLQASLALKPKPKWIATNQPTTFTKINWIAPLAANKNRLLIKTNTQIILYDHSTQAVVQSLDVYSGDVIKLSKSFDPHVVIKTGPTSMKLIYTDGMALLSRAFELKDEVLPILHSDLDLKNDKWTYVYLKNTHGYSLFNDVNQRVEQRQLVRFRISDKLPLQNKAIQDRTQIKLTSDFYFALYPSVLGRAEVYSIESEQMKKMEKFNLKKY
jgi:hypothetical protein